MRKSIVCVTCLLMFASRTVSALELGAIEARSALYEPLDARIALHDVRIGDIEGMRVTLGSRSQFEAAGVPRPFHLTLIEFAAVREGEDGHIHLRTYDPVIEPFLTFLIDVDWPGGHSGVGNVVIAITIPEIPRVVRLVRSVVLSIREQPYVEAAVAGGTRLPRILWMHILPNTVAPLIVQATYVCASAIVIEAILSFLGAGTPPEIPSWGNIMAEGRVYVQVAPWMIFFPGVFLAGAVLAVNILGDGLRDSLDPRVARRM